LKLQYDEPLSTFAFNFILRRYNTVTNATLSIIDLTLDDGRVVQVDPSLTRCLTLG